jgi:hypothetical protein
MEARMGPQRGARRHGMSEGLEAATSRRQARMLKLGPQSFTTMLTENMLTALLIGDAIMARNAQHFREFKAATISKTPRFPVYHSSISIFRFFSSRRMCPRKSIIKLALNFMLITPFRHCPHPRTIYCSPAHTTHLKNDVTNLLACRIASRGISMLILRIIREQLVSLIGRFSQASHSVSRKSEKMKSSYIVSQQLSSCPIQ